MTYKPRSSHPDFPIHITARANNRVAFPAPLDEVWELFSDYLYLTNKLYDLKIHGFVLMPNHFHLIARDPTMQLAASMNHFLRETSKTMGKDTRQINRVWGGRFHSSLITSPLYYLHAYKYVYRNPVRAGLCDDPFDYKYSTLRSLVGLDNTIIPLECDDTLFDNFESTVQWLQSSPRPQETCDTGLALRRNEFKFPRDEATKKPNFLDSAASLPEAFRKGSIYPGG